MLSIAYRGNAGEAEDYYEHLNENEEYYDVASESGEWQGLGLAGIGIEEGSTVTKSQFSELLRGRSPQGKDLVKNAGENHRSGWDLTFSAPKSVSVIWGLSDKTNADALMQAHQNAVAKALMYIEEQAAITRSGANGETKQKAGLIIAKYTHETSRNNDMSLHTHSFVMNVSQREDGKYGAIESRKIFQHKMSAGSIYRTHLSHELRLLNYETQQDSDSFRITNLDKKLETEFSTRRAEILQSLKDSGHSGAKASEIAALSTRSSKDHTTSKIEIKQNWLDRAEELGYTTEMIDFLRENEAIKEREINKEEILELLTDKTSVFKRRDLTRAIAINLLDKGGGYDRVKEIQEELEKENEIIHLADTRTGEAILTTRTMLNLEREMLNKAVKLSQQSTHSVSEALVNNAIEEFHQDKAWRLDKEQINALKHITLGSDIAMVSGAAGAGKSSSLAVAASVWKEFNFNIIGAAISGKAASGLQQGTDNLIPSQTIASLLIDIENGRKNLTDKDILVIDESGMIDSRTMHKLISLTEQAGAKLVLVGDEKQLQAIQAGGAHRALQERIGFAEVVGHRRQNEDWAKNASRDIRNGDLISALSKYHQKGFLSFSDDRNEAISQTVNGYIKDAKNSLTDTIMLASTRNEVAQLNALARTKLQEMGVIEKEEITIPTDTGKLQLSIGDRLLFTKNNKILNVKNGNLGILKNIENFADGVMMTIELDENRTVQVSSEEYSNLQHGFGITTHKSQGATILHTHVLTGSSMTDLQSTYVNMTRHKQSAHLYSDRRAIEQLAATAEPTQFMISYASNISEKENLELPNHWQSDFIVCRDFLNQHAERFIYSEIKDKDLTDLKLLSESMSTDNIKETTLDYIEEIELDHLEI